MFNIKIIQGKGHCSKNTQIHKKQKCYSKDGTTSVQKWEQQNTLREKGAIQKFEQQTTKSVVPKLEQKLFKSGNNNSQTILFQSWNKKDVKGVVSKLEQQICKKVLFQSWNNKNAEKCCSKVGTVKTQKSVVPKLE